MTNMAIFSFVFGVWALVGLTKAADRNVKYFAVKDSQGRNLCPHSNELLSELVPELCQRKMATPGLSCALQCNQKSSCIGYTRTVGSSDCSIYDYRVTNYIYQENCISFRTNEVPYTPPLAANDCIIDMLSWGYDDSATLGHIMFNDNLVVNTSKYVDDMNAVQDNWRGITVVLMKLETCQPMEIKNFDIGNSLSAVFKFIAYVQPLVSGDLVAVSVTAGEPAKYLSNFADILRGVGVTNIDTLDKNGKLAFVIHLKSSPIVSYRITKGQDGNLRYRVSVVGSSLSDVSFVDNP